MYRLFRPYGIALNGTMESGRSSPDCPKVDVNLLATGEEYAIPILVVDILDMWWLENYAEHIGNFRQQFHAYANLKVVGAVAGLEIDAETKQFAYDHRLFVIVADGETVKITNSADFQPKLW